MQTTDQEIKDVFTEYDKNGNGTLDRTELQSALNLLGIDLTDEELTSTYTMDDDPDTLTLEEFTKLVRERIGPIDFKQRTKECLGEFAESDDSGKLKLDRKQMMMILTQRGSQPLDVEQAQEFIDMFDKNNDGVLDVEELAEAMYPTEHGEPEQQSFTEGQAAE